MSSMVTVLMITNLNEIKIYIKINTVYEMLEAGTPTVYLCT